MNKKVTRFLSAFVCLVMVFCLMPWGMVSAAENAAPARKAANRTLGMPTHQKTIQSSGEYRYFTSFEDLQILGDESYSDWTYAVYEGSDALTISEDLYLPEKLILVVKGSMAVNSDVEFAATYLFADALTVNGTVATVYAEIYNHLTITDDGVYNNYDELHLWGDAVLSGESKVTHMDYALGYIWYHPETMDALKTAISDANAGTNGGFIYCISFPSNMTITEDVTLPANCDVYNTGVQITVAEGVTLTHHGYFWVEGGLVVDGTLVNDGALDIFWDNGGLLSVNGSCRGFGVIYVTGDLSDPFEATPGLTGYGADFNYTDEYWTLEMIPEEDPPAEELPEEPPYDGYNAYEWEVLKLANQERLAQGLNPLTVFDLLQHAADIRAVEVDQYFSHTRPDGSSWFTVFAEAGFNASSGGENIAAGQRTPEEVMNGWMNSPGHRANILTAGFAHMGVGYYAGNSDYGTGWVQLFTGGSKYTSIDVQVGEDYAVEPGTTIEEMDLLAKLNSTTYGTCYLPVAEAYCSGYDPNMMGTQTVTVSVLGVETTFQVTVGGGAMKGDFVGDNVVDDADVAYLLWHTLFPDAYPISGDGDLNGDGKVDDADVAYLLWHTLFPDAYPLS